VAKYIEQPHQRFVYVFDPNVQWTFLIEMIKIVEENKKLDYPVVVKTVGTAPKQYKQVTVPKEELSPDLALAAFLEEESDEGEDDEAYKPIDETEEGVEDDDISSLEGEEGEEEELEDGDDAAADFDAGAGLDED
jgi:hypothetical protein